MQTALQPIFCMGFVADGVVGGVVVDGVVDVVGGVVVDGVVVDVVVGVVDVVLLVVDVVDGGVVDVVVGSSTNQAAL